MTLVSTGKTHDGILIPKFVLLFAGLLTVVLINEVVTPQARRVFLLEAIGFVTSSARAGY
jgi:hypothetical protein